MPRGRREFRLFSKRRRSDGVVYDVDAFAVGDPFCFRFEVLLRVEDDFVRAGIAREFGFLFRRHCADDAGADVLGKLRDQQSRAARGSVDQRSVATLQRERRSRQIVRRHALQHHRGGCMGIDSVGHSDELGFGNDCVLRVRSRGHCPGDAIARTPVDDTFSDALDDARSFHARRERQRHFVETCAMIDVDEVHAGCVELYQTPLPAQASERRCLQAEVSPDRPVVRLVWLSCVRFKCTRSIGSSVGSGCRAALHASDAPSLRRSARTAG